MYPELLRLAALLAADAAGSPRWVGRNRAISTAYYALFHALAELCARELVGAWAPWQPFRHVYRSLDHGHARNVLKTLSSDGAFGHDAGRLAEVFLDLQARRHRADYDPGFRVSAGEMANILASAELAIHLAFALPPDERRLIAARLIGRARN